mmetsp:Transcript_22152/g.39849  ORF Transcript_22152/g.39849 Transcript_22152/m.39849 type:complete len:86 (-) Transcript_22152:75-332(-)
MRRKLADAVDGFRNTSFGPPDEVFNPFSLSPPLTGGVGIGVPVGVESLPLAPDICDANLAEGCNTPAEDAPPLARPASNLLRASS